MNRYREDSFQFKNIRVYLKHSILRNGATEKLQHIHEIEMYVQ